MQFSDDDADVASVPPQAAAPRAQGFFRGKRKKARFPDGHKGRHRPGSDTRCKHTGRKKRSAKKKSHQALLRDTVRQSKVVKRLRTTLWQQEQALNNLKDVGKTNKALTAQLARQQKDKDENYVRLPKATKDYVNCQPPAQAAKRKELSQFVQKGMERLRMPKLTDAQILLGEKYWEETFASSLPDSAMDDDKEEPDEDDAMGGNEAEAAAVLGDAWQKKWARLFRLRGVADSEGSCSISVLRRIFVAAELTNVTGGKLDELRKAMNNGIDEAIQFHELTHDGIHAGVWLEPADVIRQMLMAAGAPPNTKYKINILGDGRCFGNSRNTTFFALRIVYLDGFSSTSNEAIWPLAILDSSEKRGPLRLLTQEFRKAIKHIQTHGLHLSEEYTRFFAQDTDEVEWDTTWNDEEAVFLRDAEAKIVRRNKTFALIASLRKMALDSVEDLKPDEEKDEPAEGVEVEEEEDEPEPLRAQWEIEEEDCPNTEYEKYECTDPECDCSKGKATETRVPLAARHVEIEFWLSADMKFLLMSVGMSCATANFACIYCKCNLHKRKDWAELCVDKRKAGDAINIAEGQIAKDLWPFIPRTRCVIDTLHLLLRIVDRMVHIMCQHVLRIKAKDVVKDDKKASILNSQLGPYISRLTRRRCTTFQPPGDRGSLWKLTRMNGSDYRKILRNFVYTKVVGNAEPELTRRHQTAWDDLSTIYTCINAPDADTISNRVTINAKISAWFAANLNDFLENPVARPAKEPSPIIDTAKLTVPQLKAQLKARNATGKYPRLKADLKKKLDKLITKQKTALKRKQGKEEKEADPEDAPLIRNLPLVSASFLLTPYFHCLKDHVHDILQYGNLRTFAGQNFEKMNNDHRLYWQNSNKRTGQEIPSILHQHLRVRMNPIRRMDVAKLLQCPHCEHPPYTYPRWFMKHITVEHPNFPLSRSVVQGMKAAMRRAQAMIAIACTSFATDVTTTQIERLRRKKQIYSKSYYKRSKGDRKKTTKLWSVMYNDKPVVA
jgi:hypothetical protein